MHFLDSFTLAVFAFQSSFAGARPAGTLAGDGQQAARKVHQVLQLEKPSWLENIAIRSNGDILASRLDIAELYLINPNTGSSSTIASFPGANSAWGIAEYAPDLFAVIAGNFSISTLETTPGTYSIYTIDLTKGLNKQGKVIPTLLTGIPQAQNLNGLTFKAPRTLYSSDSFAGTVWQIDTRNKSAALAVQNDPLLAPTGPRTLGVNGVRWSASAKSLYFANSFQNIVGVIPEKPNGSFGAAQKIANSLITNPRSSVYDDFALDASNNIYIALDGGNTVNFVSGNGKTQFVLAGNRKSTEIAGPTSVAFGRTPTTKKTVYVVTNGGLAVPVNGNTTVGAQVVSFEL